MSKCNTCRCDDCICGLDAGQLAQDLEEAQEEIEELRAFIKDRCAISKAWEEHFYQSRAGTEGYSLMEDDEPGPSANTVWRSDAKEIGVEFEEGD